MAIDSKRLEALLADPNVPDADKKAVAAAVRSQAQPTMAAAQFPVAQPSAEWNVPGVVKAAGETLAGRAKEMAGAAGRLSQVVPSEGQSTFGQKLRNVGGAAGDIATIAGPAIAGAVPTAVGVGAETLGRSLGMGPGATNAMRAVSEVGTGMGRLAATGTQQAIGGEARRQVARVKPTYNAVRNEIQGTLRTVEQQADTAGLAVQPGSPAYQRLQGTLDEFLGATGGPTTATLERTRTLPSGTQITTEGTKSVTRSRVPGSVRTEAEGTTRIFGPKGETLIEETRAAASPKVINSPRGAAEALQAKLLADQPLSVGELGAFRHMLAKSKPLQSAPGLYRQVHDIAGDAVKEALDPLPQLAAPYAQGLTRWYNEVVPLRDLAKSATRGTGRTARTMNTAARMMQDRRDIATNLVEGAVADGTMGALQAWKANRAAVQQGLGKGVDKLLATMDRVRSAKTSAKSLTGRPMVVATGLVSAASGYPAWQLYSGTADPSALAIPVAVLGMGLGAGKLVQLMSRGLRTPAGSKEGVRLGALIAKEAARIGAVEDPATPSMPTEQPQKPLYHRPQRPQPTATEARQ